MGLLEVTFYLGTSRVKSMRLDPSRAAGINSSGVSSASTITGTSETKTDGCGGWTRGFGRGDLNVTSAAAVNSAEGGAQSGAENPPAPPGSDSGGLRYKLLSVRRIWKEGPGQDPYSEQVRTVRKQHVTSVAISGMYFAHAASGVTFEGDSYQEK